MMVSVIMLAKAAGPSLQTAGAVNDFGNTAAGESLVREAARCAWFGYEPGLSFLKAFPAAAEI